MDAPQITMIVIFAINIALNASKHGIVREKPFNQYNLWISLLRVVVFASILKWGGWWG